MKNDSKGEIRSVLQINLIFEYSNIIDFKILILN